MYQLKLNFKFYYFPGWVGGGWVGGWVGGWGEIEIKAKLSPAEAGVWAELGNKKLYIGELDAPFFLIIWGHS
jgi:hypothetical protein